MKVIQQYGELKSLQRQVEILICNAKSTLKKNKIL